jgi:hypothetical protein
MIKRAIADIGAMHVSDVSSFACWQIGLTKLMLVNEENSKWLST